MKFYITTPIYYVNDAPHIGHAYTSVMADITARSLKKQGNEVFFLTGTDEHGQKIERSAKAKGLKPLEFCNEVSQKFVDLMADFNISNDDFIRTTEERHKNGVKAFWNKLFDNGWIYKGKYEGWYAVRDEAFYTEEELVNGKAPTGAEVEWQTEETYLFRLSLFEDILLEIYEKIPSVIFPLSRLNEVKSFVKMGLKDLSISRTSFTWGIPVPQDEKHVIYVWLDALTNYITALGYGLQDKSKYEKFWKDENAVKMHYIGKDILRFHAIFWPAFLIAERYKVGEIKTDEVLRFFKNFMVISHGWWKNNGEKMSKSLGNAISTDYLKELGVDKVRYYFNRSMQFGSDGDFSLESFKEVTNADLSNNIGNLAQRVMSFIYANCNGVIPPYSNKNGAFSVLQTHAGVYEDTLDGYKKYLETMKRRDGISFLSKFGNDLEIKSESEEMDSNSILLQRSNEGNKAVDKTAPWRLKKEGRLEEMNDAIYLLSLLIYHLFDKLQSVMPESATRGLAIFNNKEPQCGDKINKPEPIFTRL